MAALQSDRRRALEKVVKDARDVAEQGARAALETLAVQHHEPHSSMTPAQRELRARLRAHGRQLGDERDERKGGQQIDRLVAECAYEHWHRMLFARFLAENDLLIEPESGAAVTLDECGELAKGTGHDAWEIAGRFAQRMLPQVFRTDDPVLQVVFSPETRIDLEKLLASLPREVFLADDSLGWTYQFWQSAEKDRVNEAGSKITGRTLPAVTQLFTDHYMVLFLLHNTIGAWWAAKQLEKWTDEQHAGCPDELAVRRAVALPEYDFEYLRFVRDEPARRWQPAAGDFESWPGAARELRVLDPCCGSGHFLVAAFELLTRLRECEEDLPRDRAALAVLEANLFGLELDPRCTQIAAFALAFAAWKRMGLARELPQLAVACSGLSIHGDKSEWAALGGGDKVLSDTLEVLHDKFTLAPEVGSLLDPREAHGSMPFAIEFAKVLPVLKAALTRGDTRGNHEQLELGVAAKGLALTADILARTYTLVVTNVPYLARGKQGDALKLFIDEHYERSKQDLATVFLERAFRWCGAQGTVAVVSPQNWLFLDKYAKVRRGLLQEREWNLTAKLGTGAFEVVSGWVVNIALCVLSSRRVRSGHAFSAVDASGGKTTTEKAELLRDAELLNLCQSAQLGHPDARVLLGKVHAEKWLAEVASSFHGISTTDYARFGAKFWEIDDVGGAIWVFQQTTFEKTMAFGGRTQMLRWENGAGELRQLQSQGVPVVITGREAWGRTGIAISQMGDLPATIYSGQAFDDNTAVIVVNDVSLVPAVWAFASSGEYHATVRMFDQSLKVTYPTLVKVPYDAEHWRAVAASKYPYGLPQPQTNDPTQWLFHGHAAGMVAAGPAQVPHLGIADPVGPDRHPSLVCRTPNAGDTLQVAVARIAGYRWPVERDLGMVVDAAVRVWADRCSDLSHLADSDGVLALVPLRNEPALQERVRELLRMSFGETWSGLREATLLNEAAQTNGAKAQAVSLEDWLRNRFFEEHCALFHQRPFVWHVWDGRKKDGFGVLVHYHRLVAPNGAGRRLLEKLTHGYLGDWIKRQRDEASTGNEGADARLAAALALQEKLTKILEGEPPYDLFVRWKPLHQQPIGWEPDINDGVRINIRPFVEADILRVTPKIKWTKDRGSEPHRPKSDFPWFWGWDERAQDFAGGSKFTGARFNDLHYTTAFKRAARERAREQTS